MRFGSEYFLSVFILTRQHELALAAARLVDGSVCLRRVGSSVFATLAMRKMEKLSEMLRKRQEMPPRPPLPENGSKTVPSRSRLEARLASAVPRLSMLSRYRRLLLKC